MEYLFAVIVTEHRLWGFVFQPCVLKRENDDFFVIREYVTVKNIGTYSLSETEKKIVLTCDKYSELNILKLFSRERISIAEFLKNYEKNPKEYEPVLPYIDKYNYKTAQLLIGTDVPLFMRKDNYLHIYSSDRIAVPTSFATHIVAFERTESFFYYRLRIYQDGKLFPIKNKKIITLSNSPCSVVAGDHLLVFESLDASRLTPFLTKEAVSVPKKSEDVYLKTFVLNTLKEEPVEAAGFSVIKEDSNPVPQLTIMEDLDRQAAIKLSFRYNQKTVSLENPAKKIVSLEQNGEDYVFRILERAADKEDDYLNRLVSNGFKQYNLFFYSNKDSSGQQSLYNVLKLLMERKDQLRDFEINQEPGEKKYILEDVFLTAGLKIEKDWFDVYGSVRVGEFTIPFAKFRKHILSGTREYILPDKTIALLPEEWFTRYSEIFKFSSENDGHLHIKKLYQGIMDIFSEKIPKIERYDENIEKDVPEGVTAQLRPYQKKGFSWLVYLYENNFGGCLADDMGLGKTIQFLALFQYIYAETVGRKKEQQAYNWIYDTTEPTLFDQLHDNLKIASEPGKNASLIVLPTSLLHNWKNEKEKFTPGLSIYLYAGKKRIRSKDIGRIFNHYNLILTTYGVMRNDLDYLKQYEFDCIVLDESQYIKNTSSQVYQSVMELNAKHFFVATGTPIENSLIDLWAQLNFVNRGMLGSLSYFKKHFIHSIVYQQNEMNRERLQKLIRPFILRRTKSEVAKDLPPLIEQTVYCEMGKEQARIYQSEKSAARNELFLKTKEFGVENNNISALTALMRLRQLANHPLLVQDGYKGDSVKMDEIVSRIESLRSENHKVLIFSSFVKLLDLLIERLNEQNIKFSLLTGATQDRQKVIREFQENDATGCFLISLKAGGVGLNLTAADYVFIIDPWWNPAAEMQAISRAHRIGQDKTVMVYRFITMNTVEEKIRQLQQEKADLAHTFIGENDPFERMNAADIEKLFDFEQ